VLGEFEFECCCSGGINERRCIYMAVSLLRTLGWPGELEELVLPDE
jgi:hypothetical protein